MKRFLPLLLLSALPLCSAEVGYWLQKFEELDKNHDGKLTPEELTSKVWFERLDLNRDKSITMAEATQALVAAKMVTPPAGEPAATVSAAPIQEAPKPLNPAECGVGSLIADVPLPTLDGKTARLSEYRDRPALVVASIGPTCPVSKRYLPTLAALEKEFAVQSVPVVLLTGDPADAALRETLKAAGLEKTPCLLDPEGRLRRALGSTSSTDCFILDATRTLIYRGAIDDQYGLGYSRAAAQHFYLKDALAEALAGKRPRLAATEAPGCTLDLAPAVEAPAKPTFHGQISRIMQAHCQECHRQGGVAPFSLETYEQVTAKAGMVRKMVERGLMPPWLASAPAKGEHSPWINDRSLSTRERSELLAWLAEGKPAGDPVDAPRPQVYSTEWRLGTPDQVFQIPQPIDVPATGIMPYQRVVLETKFETDQWVRGFEVRPTAREVVHHVIVSVLSPEGKSLREAGTGFLAAYVPGSSSVLYPEGFAKSIPKGAKLRFQIHYTPNGAPARDQSQIALYFASAPPEHVVRVADIANVKLSIPPGAENHEVKAAIPVPRDVLVLGLMPHMHTRGKSFKYVATLPDGSQRTLLDVPRWDFNWQISYRYASPLSLPAGTRIEATAFYDNSTNNPANPDPNATVRWGEQTFDEMMLGYVEFCFAAPDHPRITKAN